MQLYKLVGMAVVSFAALMLIVQIGKETIGSLRPFFLEACKPLNEYAPDYQEVINCTNDNPRLIDEARLANSSSMFRISFGLTNYFASTECRSRRDIRLVRHGVPCSHQ